MRLRPSLVSWTLDRAIAHTSASKRAVTAVQRLMRDKKPRTDTQIWFAVSDYSYPVSASTLRHARLVLEMVGKVKDTGTRASSGHNRGTERVWVWT